MLDRQYGIEQQNALLRPRHQAAVIGARNAQVTLEFLEDILQRWRRRHAGQHGEAKTMCLAGAVVGILAEHDDFDPIEWRGVQGGENLAWRRMDRLASTQFGAQELRQALHFRSIKIIPDARFPRRLEFELV